MGQLTISNAPIQFINLIIYERSLNSFYEYNLKPEMFGPYEGLMRKVIEFTEEYGETPVIETVIEWDSDFYICYEVQDPFILARQMQVDYFYRTKFNKKLNECIDNVQISPEEAMKDMAQFCIENTKIIYGQDSVVNTNYINDIIQGLFNNPPQYIPTGIDSFDKVLNGGLLDEFTVLGGNTGTFKTTLLQYIADNIAKQGHHVTYVSLEIAKRDLMFKSVVRNLNHVCGIEISTSDIKHGKFDKDIVNHISELDLSYMNNITYIDSTDIKDINLSCVMSAIREDIFKHDGKSVVMIDYLQLVKSDRPYSSDTRTTIDDIIGELKQITVKYGCPVLAISSIGRSSYGRRITLNSFKESGMIEYMANIVVALNYPENVFLKEGDGKVSDTVNSEALNKWRSDRKRDIDLEVLKNRDDTSGHIIGLTIDGKICDVKDLKLTPRNRPPVTTSERPERPPRPSKNKGVF